MFTISDLTDESRKKEPLFYENFEKKDDIIETFVKRIEIKADLELFVNNLGFAVIDEWWFKADGNRFHYCESL